MGIQGNASLALMENHPGASHHNYLKNIETNVQRGVDLTRQLLGLARGGKYEVKPTDLNELITNSADMFGRTKKEIQIRCRGAFVQRIQHRWPGRGYSFPGLPWLYSKALYDCRVVQTVAGGARLIG
jgi:hypothetical protein